MWQIPLGNRQMRAEDNTWGHLQDNRVEWLLGKHSARHLKAYRRAGVIAFLFGGGADGTTCACDAQHDGITNPPAIGGNNRMSLNADDDGGLFREFARRFYGHRRPKVSLSCRWSDDCSGAYSSNEGCATGKMSPHLQILGPLAH